MVSQITTNQNNIGDLTSLTTTTKTSLVSSVNELQGSKQATISDLSTIRSGASAGATALQPNTSITGATKCKITYDSKGLVTAGADLSAGDITTALGYTPYNSTNPSGYITQAVDDDSTTSTTLGWSASKLNGIIGDIETTINTIRGV